MAFVVITGCGHVFLPHDAYAHQDVEWNFARGSIFLHNFGNRGTFFFCFPNAVYASDSAGFLCSLRHTCLFTPKLAFSAIWNHYRPIVNSGSCLFIQFTRGDDDFTGPVERNSLRAHQCQCRCAVKVVVATRAVVWTVSCRLASVV